jgi:hypothetical protein
MTDLRICLRKKNYVIQDYSNGRKQIKDKDGKKIKLIDRHKFLDKFKEYGLLRIAQAEMEGARETVGGVSGYKSYHDLYMSLHFPDLYLDEVDGPALEAFVKKLKAANVPYKTNKVIIQHIHTFLRYCFRVENWRAWIRIFIT